jgi:hypothetical protein
MLHVPYHCRCHPDRALRRLRRFGLQPRHHRLLPRRAAVCDRGAVIGPVKAAVVSVKDLHVACYRTWLGVLYVTHVTRRVQSRPCSTRGYPTSITLNTYSPGMAYILHTTPERIAQGANGVSSNRESQRWRYVPRICYVPSACEETWPVIDPIAPLSTFSTTIPFSTYFISIDLSF